MKTQISLRIEDDLLKAVQERAAKKNETLNGFVEHLMSYYLLRNKYVVNRKAEDLYSKHVSDKSSSSDVEYLITNGLDYMFVDKVDWNTIVDNDYVFECFKEIGNIKIKQIHKT
jgi:hypothetical protein